MSLQAGLKRDAFRLALVLSLPCLILLLVGRQPELGPDAREYFSQLRSLHFDGDLQLENEFAHYGLLDDPGKTKPTATGHRRTLYSVGPAIFWWPFYAAADLWAIAAGSGRTGYEPGYVRAVGVGSLAYAVLGALLVHRVLRDLASRAAAAAAVLLLVYATSLYWYVLHAPLMSHALSFFTGAALLAVWWPGRHELSLGRALALGSIAGVSACVRWQNLLLLLLPAPALLGGLRGKPARTLGRALMLGAGALLGALPQMLAWKAIWGVYLFSELPQGAGYIRLSRPYLLETFFSSRHGLLYWTPVLWAGLLGFVPFFRRDARAAAATLLPLAAMSWVNASVLDWWAGGSFSNRRFDSVLPLLAPPLVLALEALRALAARRPGVLLAGAGVALTLWNILFMQLYRGNHIPRDDTVSFARVAAGNATLLSEAAGAPLAWPANWLWAARNGTPVALYDRVVGTYLFYRQGSLHGRVDLGDDAAAEALLGEGWGARVPCQGESCRLVRRQARLFAPLDEAETLDVALRACGEGSLALEVNGARVAEWPLEATLAERRVLVPATHWRRGLNALVLTVSSGGWSALERVQFRQADVRP